jgi:predicted nucleic-acid-binding Zn-ribbon protein
MANALVTVRGREFTCLVCGGREFGTREIKLNTTGMEFFDLGWANRSSLGVICAACGYVHEFLGDAVELWAVDGGYPR